MRKFALIAIFIGPLLLLGFPTHCCAQQGARDTRDNSAKATGSGASAGRAKPQLAVTPEREAAVMTFVGRNHAELGSLLDLLKANQPKEYERAIRELYRVTDKLATVQERDREQYNLELQAWQVQSRIQLLVARLKMVDSDDLRKELKEAIGDQLKARAALLRHERGKAAERLDRIDRDLTRLEGDRQELIDKQFSTLVKNASSGNVRPRAISGKKPTNSETKSGSRGENSAKTEQKNKSIETNGSSKP